MRYSIVLLVIAAFAVLVSALASGRDAVAPPVEARVTPVPFVTADPAVTARVDPEVDRGWLARDDRVDHRVVRIRGLSLPIEGATIPTDPDLLPDSAREYRAGWHEGIDFPAPGGTAVHAVAAGTIVRIDHDFVDWDEEHERAALEGAHALGYTPSATLDRIRGRQVWIDHGHGVVTRYAHLATVAGLAVGDTVTAGTVIGAVGSSGYPEGGPHLHLEVRVGASYLGDGLAGDVLRAAIDAAFG